ncbi:DUF3298 and DUF4163 domain-containing protein [Metabacillus fastidiosus]|uniref:DUF3298 and DUF4163 domain-containing protein n=1 Tax=Metabacillus fastidiosus TaxID=1458 RepID=UPI002E22EB66|nr:DUF3298 and DUF4163 domain-containing protein [Metabacillus fastidiosus]
MRLLKKLLLFVLAAGLVFGLFLPGKSAEATVMWGSSELKKGQIGRATIVNDTSIYKKSGDQYVYSRKAKKGEVLRVYTNRGGYLGIGSGQFLQNNKNIKYETPSKSRLQAVNGIKVVRKTYENTSIKYPQVTNMADPSAEKAINSLFYNKAKEDYQAYLQLMKDNAEHKADWEQQANEDWPVWVDYSLSTDYEVHYNYNNQLSIVLYTSVYYGGAHPLTGAETFNFNAANGKQYELKHIMNNKTKTVKNYAIKDLQNQHKRGNVVFLDSLNSIQIGSSQAWVFHNKGIKLIFQQYEVAPYAAGFPTVVVPGSVYK